MDDVTLPSSPHDITPKDDVQHYWLDFSTDDLGRALLGTIMWHNSLDEVMEFCDQLRPEDFSHGGQALIFKAMLSTSSVDPVLLADWIRTKHGRAQLLLAESEFGSIDAYLNCADQIGSGVAYADRLLEHSTADQISTQLALADAANKRGDLAGVARHLAKVAELQQEGEPTESEGRYKVYTLDEALERPRPPWVWHGHYRVGDRGMLYGESHTGKSLEGIDRALCFATGESWGEYPTLVTGKVLYITPEDFRGVAEAARTWLSYHHKTVADVRDSFHLIEDAVELLDPADVARLVARIQAQGIEADFVVIDTFFECFSGNEIDNQALRMAFHGVGAIEQALGASSLLIHHSKKDGTAYRGGSYIKGVVDVLEELSQDADTQIVTIRYEKRRGAPKPPPIARKIATFTDERTLEPVAVMVAARGFVVKMAKLKPAQESVLLALKDGMRATEWQKASGLSSSTFYEQRDFLCAADYVTASPYSLTEKGRDYLKENHSTPLQNHSGGELRSTPLHSVVSIETEWSGVPGVPGVPETPNVPVPIVTPDTSPAASKEAAITTHEAFLERQSSPRLPAVKVPPNVAEMTDEAYRELVVHARPEDILALARARIRRKAT